MRYLQHGNWHVREGALQLIAHCIISQVNSNTQQQTQIQLASEQDSPLSTNPSLVMEICSLTLNEDKQKIQQYVIDVLALSIDKSPERNKTQLLIQRSLGIVNPLKSQEEAINSNNTQKEYVLYKQVIERLQRGNLPYINEEGIVEFPQASLTNVVPPKFNSHASFRAESEQEISYQETLASNMTKLPSQGFMDQKKKFEEEKKTQLLRYSSIEKELKEAQDSNPKEIEKIAMWLPSFIHNNSAQEQIQTPLQINQVNKNVRSSLINQSIIKNDHLNATQSSVATFLDDGKSSITQTTMQSLNHQVTLSDNKQSLGAYGMIGSSQYMKSPIFSEKQQSQVSSENSHRQYGQVNQNQNAALQNQQQNFSYGSNFGRLGYTPEQHASKPRNIQSNEMQQRAVDGFPYNNNSYSQINENQTLNSDGFQFDIQLTGNLQKNMSHSSGGAGGFGVYQGKGPQVTDKLKLLKSNSKYKQTANSQSADKRQGFLSQFEEQDGSSSFNNEVNERIKNMNPANHAQNQKKYGFQPGPIKAQHNQEEFLQTINNEDFNNNNSLNFTPGTIKTKKPPMSQKTSSTNTKIVTRAQSVDNSLPEQSNDNSGDIYQAVQEPLSNPEQHLKQSIDQLKSGDWAKQFEACGTLKRIVLFHQQLLSPQGTSQSIVIKELIKIVDSLRSQLAKNSILTITLMLETMPSKDLDNQIDIILPGILKKAADTNAFIAESADNALITLCSSLSEYKVFSCLQSQQNVKSNPMKMKMALCYNTLIEKIGPKIRQFNNVEKLVQTVITFLNEGAIEVRNMGKIGLLAIKNAVGSQRELDGLLNRCVTNEKQLEKIKQILDKNDFESISNNGSTRYGTSMRGSSLDTRSAGQFRNGQQPAAAGSDGFGKFTSSSDFGVQNAQLKNPGGLTVGASGQGFSITTNTFKKQNNLVSKPVDPMVMEDFKQIIAEVAQNDWNKRIKAIDSLQDFVKNYQTTIKQAQPAKFIQLIDAYSKLLNDNNAKVLSQAQQSFRIILLNQNLRPLIEQNLTMIVQSLTNNLQSTNSSAREQGDLLMTMLESAVDPNQLIPPIVAQINLANNRSKAQLVERLSNLIERVDKVSLIQKYVCPIIQSSNKIQTEANSNTKLKESLQKLQNNTNPHKEQKRGLLEDSKLSRIINDSQLRRNRAQREGSKTQVSHRVNNTEQKFDQQAQNIQLVNVDEQQVVEEQVKQHPPSKKASQHSIMQQCDDSQSLHSTQTLHSNNSRRQAPGPNNYAALENNFNSTISSTKLAKAIPKRSATNYIEKNKQELEALKQKALSKQQSNDEQLLQQQVKVDMQRTMTHKEIKSKINSGVSRSKSAIGKVQKTKTQEKKYQLDLSPDERIKDDLRRKVTKEAHSEIKSNIDDKYADLEKMLQQNLGNISNIQEEQPSQSKQNPDSSQINMDNENEILYKTMSSVKHPVVKTSNKKLNSVQSQDNIMRKKSQPPSRKNIEAASQPKTPKINNQRIQYTEKKVSKPTEVIARSEEKPQVIKFTKTSKSKPRLLQAGYTPTKLNEPNIQTPSMKTQQLKPAVPKINLKSQKVKSDIKFISSNKKSGIIDCDPSIIDKRNESPVATLELNNLENDEIELQSSSVKSYKLPDYKLESKEDYLNFSIEQIWKEMEEIGRSKRAAQDLFKAFQEQYYDKNQPYFFNQGECSPTKRLISMKNATAKHHNIESNKGIKDGKYSLQYTTCPEKSFVVKPDEGRIDYDKFRERNAGKFVEKVINGKVEKYEIKESKSPLRKSLNSIEKSPVKISKQHCARSSLLGHSVTVNTRLEEKFVTETPQEKEKEYYSTMDVQEINDPELIVNIDTEDYAQSEDVYDVESQQQKALVEASI